MNLPKPCIQRQSGLSLIELMVALAVSAILLLGVTTVYTASKRSYQVTDEFAGLQENARFALNVLTRNIRMAGFTGCGNLEFMEVNNNVKKDKEIDSDYDFTDDLLIVGYAASDTWPNKPTDILDGTNAITIRKGSACSAALTGTMPNKNSAIETSGTCDFQKGEILLITDCETADIFEKTNTAEDKQENNGDLSKAYGSDAFVYKFEHLIYYIQNNTEGKPSLYQKLVGGAETELVPNVEDMVLNYGIDTDGNNSINEIRSSAAAVPAADWSKVINVYVRLLFRSDEVGTANKPYRFNGTDVAATDADKHYRKEFVTAINLRNRTP